MIDMAKLQLPIKAIAAIEGVNFETLAKKCGIDYGHLKQVSAGNARMTADDLRKLSANTGIPVDNIKI